MIKHLVVLALLLSGCATVSPPTKGWMVLDTEDIRVRTNIDRAHAEEFARQMQGWHDALSMNVLRCGSARRVQPIEVTILWPSDYEAVAPKNVEAFFRSSSHPWLDGFAPQIVLSAESGSHARQTFQHELTHRLVAACFPAAPVWLNEGMAGFLETALARDGKLILGLPSYVIHDEEADVVGAVGKGGTVTLVRRDLLPAVADLVAMTPKEFYRHEWDYDVARSRVGNYAAAWGLVHLLEVGAEDLHTGFVNYLAALGQGGWASAAWDSLMAADLQARLDEYLFIEQLPYIEVPLAEAPVATLRVQGLDEGLAHAHLAWLWLDGDPEHERLASEHLEAASRHTTSRARARSLQAVQRMIKGDLAGAKRVVDEALVQDPHDPTLLTASVEFVLATDGSIDELEERVPRLRQVATTAEQLSVLALAEIARGNLPEAIRTSERATGLNPYSWMTRSVRAGVYEAEEQFDKALLHYERALGLVPDQLNGVRASILKKLETLQSAKVAGGTDDAAEGG